MNNFLCSFSSFSILLFSSSDSSSSSSFSSPSLFSLLFSSLFSSFCSFSTFDSFFEFEFDFDFELDSDLLLLSPLFELFDSEALRELLLSLLLSEFDFEFEFDLEPDSEPLFDTDFDFECFDSFLLVFLLSFSFFDSRNDELLILELFDCCCTLFFELDFFELFFLFSELFLELFSLGETLELSFSLINDDLKEFSFFELFDT